MKKAHTIDMIVNTNSPTDMGMSLMSACRPAPE
jgi:hypothetical protein